MSFSVGIIGLPNVGKSTLFKAITRKQALIANYPFATINPNVGVVEVPDERLSKLARVSKSEKIVPTTIEFVDIAGLVRGASKGEGLGNKFLSHIREVAAIVQVVRSFSDLDIIHVSGKVNPKSDLEIVNMELALADLESASHKLTEFKNQAKAGLDSALEKNIALFEKIKEILEKGGAIRDLNLTDEDKEIIKSFNFLTAKPMLLVINCDEGKTGEVSEEKFLKLPVIKISAKLEAELADLSLDEAKAYLSSLGQKETGLDKLIVASYKLLDLITFLTSGEKETKAWTVKSGTKAPKAAGVIHSDFEKAFIRAEVCTFQDFIKYGGWSQIKKSGKMRLEGKDYVMRDGDVVFFHVAVYVLSKDILHS
jgi:GTP-binding protein YchF